MLLLCQPRGISKPWRLSVCGVFCLPFASPSEKRAGSELVTGPRCPGRGRAPLLAARAVAPSSALGAGAGLQALGGWGVCPPPLLPSPERGLGEGWSHSWLLSGPGAGLGCHGDGDRVGGVGGDSVPFHLPHSHLSVSWPRAGPAGARPSWGEGLDLCPRRPQGK